MNELTLEEIARRARNLIEYLLEYGSAAERRVGNLDENHYSYKVLYRCVSCVVYDPRSIDADDHGDDSLIPSRDDTLAILCGTHPRIAEYMGTEEGVSRFDDHYKEFYELRTWRPGD